MRIAFMLMAHADPETTLNKMRVLLAADDVLAVHWDKKSKFDFYEWVRPRLEASELERVRFVPRVAVPWGEWGMIEATLRCMEAVRDIPDIDYLYLVSAAECLIKPLASLKDFLTRKNGTNFLECVNPHVNKWVKGGIVHERYTTWHFFNYRDHGDLVRWSCNLQSNLGIRRLVPDNMAVYFGSQWWCLTRRLAMAVLDKARRPDIQHFFSRTCIPDEMFFQTIAASIEDPANFAPQLTFYEFDENGKPFIFYDDHYDLVKGLPHFFIRKVSDQAGRIMNLYRDESPVTGSYVSDYGKNAFYVPFKPLKDHKFFQALLANDKKYVLYVSTSPEDSDWAYGQLSGHDSATFYYDVLNPKAIVYGAQTPEHPYYGHSISLRDHSRLTFIRDLITNTPNLPIFSISQAEFCFHQLFWDSHCVCLFHLPEQLAGHIGFSHQAGEFHISVADIEPAFIEDAKPEFRTLLSKTLYYINECAKHSKPFITFCGRESAEGLVPRLQAMHLCPPGKDQPTPILPRILQ